MLNKQGTFKYEGHSQIVQIQFEKYAWVEYIINII